MNKFLNKLVWKIISYRDAALRPILKKCDQIEYLQMTQTLCDRAVHSKERGVSEEMYGEYELVVSLTTYGKRLDEVYLAIESIMQGTMLPNRIVLWLAEDELNNRNLPITLKNQQKRGLEIGLCKDLRSYTKYIPSLKKYPNSIIITIDDDIIYNFDFVERLWQSYKTDKNAIWANRVHLMKDKNGYLDNYLTWFSGCAKQMTSDSRYFFTGVGGVLYPPHIFNQEILDEGIFMTICPYADDVWFNAMALYSGVKVYKAQTRDEKGLDYYELKNVQDQALFRINILPNVNMNDVQIKAVFTKYGIYDLLGLKSPK